VPETYVIDCSVAFKWFLGDEPDTDKADLIQERFLLGQVELIAPPHFRYEFGHGLRRAARRIRINATDADQAFTDFLALGIRIESQGDSELQATWDLQTRLNSNFYDTAYVALAKRLGCKWLTADDAFPASHSEVSASISLLNSIT
jgi:predicted nucleic acid-binding protein